MRVCSFRYAACNARAPYIRLRPVRLYDIFQHYLLKCTIFGKNTEYKILVFIFSASFVRTICHSENNATSIFLDRFSKNIQMPNFMKISPVGTDFSHVDGRTDTHDEANRRFSQLFERSLKQSLSVYVLQILNNIRHVTSFRADTNDLLLPNISSLLDHPLCEEIPIFHPSRFYPCLSWRDIFKALRGHGVWKFCLALCVQNFYFILMKKLVRLGLVRSD